MGTGSLMGSTVVSVTAFVLGQQQERGDKDAARAGQPLYLKNNITGLPSEFALAHKTINCKFTGLVNLAKEQGLEPNTWVSHGPLYNAAPALHSPSGWAGQATWAAVSRGQGDPFCFYLVLNTSTDGDSTTVLGSLLQCLTMLSMKKFPQYST